MATAADRRAAVAELMGALSYALLRSFQVAARGIAAAPKVGLAERQAAFAADEFERFRVLRERLGELTDEPEDAMDAFRGALDSFYESARSDGWLEAQVFHFVGDTITTDFAETLAPRLDNDTADAVRRSLTGRTEQEAFALAQIAAAVAEDGEAAQQRISTAAGALVGGALNTLRDALFASNALEVVLGEGGVKEVVLELLGRHRERLERLGFDSLDD